MYCWCKPLNTSRITRCGIRVESSPVCHIRAADQGHFSEVALKVGLGLPGGNVTSVKNRSTWNSGGPNRKKGAFNSEKLFRLYIFGRLARPSLLVWRVRFILSNMPGVDLEIAYGESSGPFKRLEMHTTHIRSRPSISITMRLKCYEKCGTS